MDKDVAQINVATGSRSNDIECLESEESGEIHFLRGFSSTHILESFDATLIDADDRR